MRELPQIRGPDIDPKVVGSCYKDPAQRTLNVSKQTYELQSISWIVPHSKGTSLDSFQDPDPLARPLDLRVERRPAHIAAGGLDQDYLAV